MKRAPTTPKRATRHRFSEVSENGSGSALAMNAVAGSATARGVRRDGRVSRVAQSGKRARVIRWRGDLTLRRLR